jgi:predicted porin
LCPNFPKLSELYLKKSLITLALLAAAGAASASTYGLASVGQQRFSGTTGTVAESANQVKLSVGYSFSPHLAAELAWQQGGHSTSASGVHQDVEGFSLAAKGRYPVAKGLNLTAKVGVASLKTQRLSATEHANRPLVGIGAEYALNKTMALTADYEVVGKAPGLDSDLRTFSVGLKHAF